MKHTKAIRFISQWADNMSTAGKDTPTFWLAAPRGAVSSHVIASVVAAGSKSTGFCTSLSACPLEHRLVILAMAGALLEERVEVLEYAESWASSLRHSQWPFSGTFFGAAPGSVGTFVLHPLYELLLSWQGDSPNSYGYYSQLSTDEKLTVLALGLAAYLDGERAE